MATDGDLAMGQIVGRALVKATALGLDRKLDLEMDLARDLGLGKMIVQAMTMTRIGWKQTMTKLKKEEK